VRGAPDRYRLEEIANDHPIAAEVFVPFAIARLGKEGESPEATLMVDLRGLPGRRRTLRTLLLSWSPESALSHAPAVQERTVTEWAACGVACVVVRLYAALRLRHVTGDGDRFDYWVDDGSHEYGLEVSGTTTDDLEARHGLKVRQLRENPYGVDGYVVVVGFATRSVIFSFHRFAGEIG
jgi:hypothetical protein